MIDPFDEIAVPTAVSSRICKQVVRLLFWRVFGGSREDIQKLTLREERSVYAETRGGNLRAAIGTAAVVHNPLFLFVFVLGGSCSIRAVRSPWAQWVAKRMAVEMHTGGSSNSSRGAAVAGRNIVDTVVQFFFVLGGVREGERCSLRFSFAL